MYVIRCPECGRLAKTSDLGPCRKCARDLSYEDPIEVPDSVAEGPPLTDTPTQSPDGAERLLRKEPSKQVAGARDTPLGFAPGAADRPPGDSSTCKCRIPRPGVDSAVTTCKACGGAIAINGPSPSATTDGPRPSDPKRAEVPDPPPRTDRSARARLVAILPWGEAIAFSECLVLGRSAHPDSKFPSLPDAVRERLQREFTTVSRFHVLLTAEAAGLTVQDLGAMNGSFVGGTPIQPHSKKSVLLPCVVGLGGSFPVKVQRLEADR